jgi:uncharacterized protein (TIGR03083 family)
MNAAAPAWIAALRGSHERLREVVEPLAPVQLTERAYPSAWSIAQVLSHIGSGAEIFGHIVSSGATRQPFPGREVMAPIWDIWNAKTPEAMAADALVADRRLVEQFEELAGDPAGDLRMDVFGRELDLAGLVGMRLSEHALHSWDVAVALEPTLPVASQSAALLIDNISWSAGRVGKPDGTHRTVRISTTDPMREFLLTVGETITLAPSPSGEASGDAGATLRLPAESLLRLIAGRLDKAHTPGSVTATGVDLDDLRAIFPGY